MRRYKNRISRIVTVVMLFVFLIGNSNMVHAMEKTQVVWKIGCKWRNICR